MLRPNKSHFHKHRRSYEREMKRNQINGQFSVSFFVQPPKFKSRSEYRLRNSDTHGFTADDRVSGHDSFLPYISVQLALCGCDKQQ